MPNCETCKKILRRPIRIKYTAFLWVYQELEDGIVILYPKFLTEEQAENTFGGYHAYQKLNSRMITRGILTA